jgi:hypothetical protein
MDAATLREPRTARERELPTADHLVDAPAFRRLLVSHRRLVRADRKEERLRGLRDLDTGEIFLTDERRLFETRR